MALNFTTTDRAAQLNGVKVLVYGQAGAGKTLLCSTAPNPFIISAEGGELSLRKIAIPMAKVNNVDDLRDLFAWCQGAHEAKQFQTICIDSLSEIAEVVLNNAKRQVKDPRQAYGELIEKMETTIRMFRDLPGVNIYMSAKMAPTKDELTGVVKYGPSMPGSKLEQKLPYFFDEVFRLGINKTPQGETYRFLQTQPDLQYEAKDRSGALAAVEPPHLTQIFSKILGA
jgi:AAA domain